MLEENNRLKISLSQLETLSCEQKLEIERLQLELGEASTYRSAYDYMKEDLVKVKSELHLQTLEFDKLSSRFSEVESQK